MPNAVAMPAPEPEVKLKGVSSSRYCGVTEYKLYVTIGTQAYQYQSDSEYHVDRLKLYIKKGQNDKAIQLLMLSKSFTLLNGPKGQDND